MKMKLKRIIIGVLILAVAGGSYAYLKKSGQDQAAKDKAVVLPTVKASGQIIAEGKVVPAQSAALSFSVAGLTADTYVKEGDLVKAGQLLIKMENADLQVQLDKAQASLARARASVGQISGGKQGSITRAKSDYADASSNLSRSKQLFAQGVITQQELDTASNAFKKAEASLKEAQASLGGSGSDPAAVADVNYAAAAVQEVKIAIGKTEIRAPFDGTVALLDVKKGEYIQPGTPVVQMVGMGGWEIETSDLTELNIAQIKVGDPAALTFDGLPDLKMSGKITHIRIYGELKNGDITYTTRIKPERQDPNLRWNMTAIATIETGK